MEKSDGQIICPAEELPEEIRIRLASDPNHICMEDGYIYLELDRTIFRLPDDPAAKALAYAAVHRKKVNLSRPGSVRELYEKILNDPGYCPDSSLIRELRIRQPGLRCVAVFRSCSPTEKDLGSILLSMAPVEKGDAVIPVDYQTALFIKDLDGQSAEEMREFTEAVIGTMESEGVADVRAGIGCGHSDITDLRTAYSEGLQALRLGLKYHRQERVYTFCSQTLERIVDSIPAEQKESILREFSVNSKANGMSDEMLETVRVFFQNDLNLTAASKQLFIHRNTLNYRLDKIKKDFGLDLRSFQDAVIFRVVSEIANESK